MTVEVHWYDPFCSRRDGSLDEFRIYAPRLRLYVHEHWLRTAIADGVGGRNVGERWQDHFVSRLKVERPQRQVQRNGTVCACNGGARSAKLRIFFLETLDERARADPAALESF